MDVAIAVVLWLLGLATRVLSLVVAWYLIVLVDPKGARRLCQWMLRLVEKSDRERGDR